MKKALLLSLILLLSVSLIAGCGGGGNPPEPTIGEGPITDLTFEELITARDAFDFNRDETTYDDVAKHFGVHGLVDEDFSATSTSASWYASDNGYITVFFNKETGLYTSGSSSALGRP